MRTPNDCARFRSRSLCVYVCDAASRCDYAYVHANARKYRFHDDDDDDDDGDGRDCVSLFFLPYVFQT